MSRTVYAETIMDTGFDAKLKGVTLADLIQMKCLSGATESFRITSRTRTGSLHFSNGTIAFAAAGEWVGDEAVLEMLKWTTGTFEFAPAPPPSQAGVKASWQTLLLEAAKALDEKSRHVPLLAQGSESGVRPSPIAAKEAYMNNKARPLIPISPMRTTEVRLDASGRILNGKNDHEELAAVTAYVLHVAGHIGTCLGLDPFKGCEFRSGELRTVVAVDDDGEIGAVQSKVDADVAEMRARAGL